MRSGIAAAALMTAAACADAQAQTIEVMHYWTAPGETAALDVFADAYRKKGGAWDHVGVPTKLTMRRRAIERILMGFPPTAAQWHAGPELDELYALGLVRPLDEVADADALRAALQPAVIEAISHGGVLAALPVGIHGSNWAWYNTAIYRELGLEIPGGWRAFLKQAPVIAKAGYQPLSVGDWNWEAVLVFNTVLIDIAGKPVFRKMLKRAALTETERAAVREAVSTFRALREYASPEPAGPTGWNVATARVIEGKAALQIMGDWAKAEFLSAGKTPGAGFECRLAPGNDDALMFLLDVFVLAGKADTATPADDIAKQAQAAFVDTLLDPANQLAFAKAKGALPVVRRFDRSALDECALLGLSKLDRPESTVASVAVSFTIEQQAVLETAVIRLWKNQDAGDTDAADTFIRAMFE